VSLPNWIPLFDEVAPDYDQIVPFFSAFADQFAAWVQAVAGTDVLDIATGRGAIISALTKLTGKDCRFVGIDLSAQMLSHTTDDFARRGLATVRFEQMDAERLTFADESFDLVTSGFAIHLLNDPANAIAEAFRTLRPGGHFAFSTPGRSSGRCADFYDALSREFSERIASESRDQSRLRSVPMLTDAGFIDLEAIEVEIHVPVDTPDAFWNGEMSHGRRRFFEQLADSDLAEFRDRLFAFLEKEQAGDGIMLDRGAIFHKARKPSGRDESRR
jgi:ubiquinone/menaquinone biosynthesis C-methylase UbiE